jgi:molybdate transport system substrate-binding protein
LIAAASDLQAALPGMTARFATRTGIAMAEPSFAASGQLSEQIKAGAPFDVFMAANESFVRDLAKDGLIKPESVQPYARGSLVLAVFREHENLVKSLEDLARPEVKKIALANPATAPYGKAGKQALERAGLWAKVEPKIVIAESVRHALIYAQNGNAEVALVGRAIARVPEIRPVAVEPDLYDPIIQALGIVASSKRAAEAEQFVAFVLGDEGQGLLRQYGFQPAATASSTVER